MRREVARAAATAAAIALVVLAVPLAVAIHLLVVADESGELERVALRVATRVDVTLPEGAPVPLPRVEAGTQLGLYDASGRLRSGTGAARADDATQGAFAGSAVQARAGGVLEVAVPIVRQGRVAGVVRVASPTADLWRRTAAAWGLLAAVTLAALLAALAVARRRARRLAAPLESLAAASRAIGDGDFDATVAPSGIPEIDRVARTQNATAARLGALLERERRFAADASHQLRTPLAGLQLGLEAATTAPDGDCRNALAEALVTTRRLQATVEDLLALQRGVAPDGNAERADTTAALHEILQEAVDRWQGAFAAAGRQLSQARDAGVDPRLPAVRVGQVLDVLLDNALRHGDGAVMVHARRTGPATAVDVADEGAGVPGSSDDVFRRGTGSGHGIGLHLARDLAQSMGGRLFLSARTPPVFTLLLPGPTPAPRLMTGRRPGAGGTGTEDPASGRAVTEATRRPRA